MNIGLGDLTEHQDDLKDLAVHVVSDLSTAGHDIEQRRGQRIEEALSDEHSAEVILRGRTLQLEHAADPIECVDDEFRLFCVIFVQQVDKNLQAATSETGVSRFARTRE